MAANNLSSVKVWPEASMLVLSDVVGRGSGRMCVINYVSNAGRKLPSRHAFVQLTRQQCLLMSTI